MGFSSKQVRALQRGVPARNIRIRKLDGRELAYIEGWRAIAEANRIFGFDGWDRETTESRCILGRETRGMFLAIYTAKVRISVRADGATIVREGNGSGEARSISPGEAHEIALKGAETDATKRALATFGRPFGLALYLNRQPPIVKRHEGQSAEGGRLLNGASFEPETSARDPLSQPSGGPAAPTTVKQTEPISAMDSVASESNKLSTEAKTAMALTSISPVPVRIDKSMLAFGEPRRERDKHHLLFVATQPCLICGRAPSDAHHLRFAQSRAMGRKVGDQFTVPLCRVHHHQVHECPDEAAWWTDLEVDALEIAKGLWEQSRAQRANLVRVCPRTSSGITKFSEHEAD